MARPSELPDGLRLQRTTRQFDETSVPAGLLAAHRIAEGRWGRLVVFDGALDFVFEAGGETGVGPASGRPAPRRLIAGDVQVIPPGVAHHVDLCGPVRFHVEFHR